MSHSHEEMTIIEDILTKTNVSAALVEEIGSLEKEKLVFLCRMHSRLV